jgi:hypothetical protein
VGDKKNLDGAGNYVFMEATGRGHFVGVTQAVEQNQDGWFGEGDDMIFIDGDALPTINGTGTEDYYNGAWDFGGQPSPTSTTARRSFRPQERIGGRYCLYRWHIESPITFEKSIKVTIEHGHANHRSDNFYSTAYWYQTEPHAAFSCAARSGRSHSKIVSRRWTGAAHSRFARKLGADQHSALGRAPTPPAGRSAATNHVRRAVGILTRRQELRNRVQVVARVHQRAAPHSVLAHLPVANVGHQRVAQALAPTVSSTLPPLAT